MNIDERTAIKNEMADAVQDYGLSLNELKQKDRSASKPSLEQRRKHNRKISKLAKASKQLNRRKGK